MKKIVFYETLSFKSANQVFIDDLVSEMSGEKEDAIEPIIKTLIQTYDVLYDRYITIFEIPLTVSGKDYENLSIIFSGSIKSDKDVTLPKDLTYYTLTTSSNKNYFLAPSKSLTEDTEISTGDIVSVSIRLTCQSININCKGLFEGILRALSNDREFNSYKVRLTIDRVRAYDESNNKDLVIFTKDKIDVRKYWEIPPYDVRIAGTEAKAIDSGTVTKILLESNWGIETEYYKELITYSVYQEVSKDKVYEFFLELVFK